MTEAKRVQLLAKSNIRLCVSGCCHTIRDVRFRCAFSCALVRVSVRLCVYGCASFALQPKTGCHVCMCVSISQTKNSLSVLPSVVFADAVVAAVGGGGTGRFGGTKKLSSSS